MGKLTIKESLEITKNIKDLKRKELTWSKIAELTNQKYGTSFTKEQVRDRARKSQNKRINNNITEYEEHFSNGEIEVNKAVFLNGVPKTAEDVLNLLGYEKDCWQVKNWRVGEWDTSMKDADGNPTVSTNRTIKATLAPREDELTPEKSIEIFESVVKNIKPLKVKKEVVSKERNKNLLKEFPGIELHLGKFAWSGETGQNYDKDIAIKRFYQICEEIIKRQQLENASECLYCIGNDFFNSDTPNGETANGTPLSNDTRGEKMFEIGVGLNKNMIELLRKNFDMVHIRLMRGNHDFMTSYYLYRELKEHYKDIENIEFADDTKELQSFVWGSCGIFFTHGCANEKRVINAIPSEFNNDWGNTDFHELHMGHLHKEDRKLVKQPTINIDEDAEGMIVRRLGAPTGTDKWHYEKAFLGATQKYQAFLWDKEYGLKDVQYVCFKKDVD